MSDLLQFPGSKPLPEETIRVQPDHNYCEHEAIRLDVHERAVRCAKCDRVLDAFNFLVSNAHTLQRAWHNYWLVTKELGELNERVDALKAEEKRLKARLKTVREKVEPTIHVRGANVR